ncbi:MAG: 2Fe-2S iron-sulfur cluster-binding protein, partial [Dokdonella sp.]
MRSIDDNDYGTPAIHSLDSLKPVQLEIDGVAVRVPAGTSVMRAAATHRIDIPRLCATDTLDAFGSCRLCLVQIEGMKGYPASCTTPVAEGMKVTTQSAKLGEIRRGVIELYVSDHAPDCVGCAPGGRCELQEMAAAVGLERNRYGIDGANHFRAEHDGIANPLFVASDASNPYFRFDPAQCIVCSRCVRACDEVQGTFALTIEGRGFESRVVASQDESFLA